MLERACLDRRRWARDSGCDRLGVAINVSTEQLMMAGFGATVAAGLSATATDPGLVTLELTEDVFVQDSRRGVVVLNDLKQLGVMLALDDFGTGCSSLSHLKLFPVDVVKVDHLFTADVDHDAASRMIVGAVVDLAHGLGMTVIAEGVESVAQYDEMVALGCDAYQGSYASRPLPADDVSRMLAGAHRTA